VRLPHASTSGLARSWSKPRGLVCRAGFCQPRHGGRA
jgi:hypothetical protein